MKSKFILAIAAAIAATATFVTAQQPARPLSSDGVASVQILGSWVKSERQTYTMGGARYEGGKWIDILYGRPLLRDRQAFPGTGAEYGKATYGPDAIVWRAGANFTTRLRSEVPLVIGGTTVPAGEHTVFLELKSPTEWTFIVSNWPAQTKYDPSNKTEIYGAFNYTSDKDVLRTPMKVDTLPIKIEQLTWQFLDMTADGGRMGIMWDTTMGSVPFRVNR